MKQITTHTTNNKQQMTTSTKYAYIALALTMYPVYTTANPMLSINVYESPPTRWITNGVLVVGVTDGECSITTSIKHETKWGAGDTFNLYKAVNILKYMHIHGFNNILDPSLIADSSPFNGGYIEASLEYYYGNCKILVKNETDITEEEYITSYAIVSKSAEKYFYNSVEAIDLNNNNNDRHDDTTILIIIGIICSVFIFCFTGCCIYHNKH